MAPEPDKQQQRIQELEAELEAARRAHQQLGERLGSLYESLPDPLLTVDCEGVVRACSRTGMQWLGPRFEHLVGTPLVQIFEEDSAQEVQRLLEQAWAGVREHRFTLADGRRVTISAVPGAGEAEEGWLLTLRDITTRELLDEAQIERRRVAALAELAGAVARELNDPMSIVQGRLELLLALGEQEPAALERHLSVALDHARRISATLRNLRLVGRAPVPKLDRVYLSEVIQDATHMVGHRIRRLEFVVDLEAPDLAVGGDTAMLTRVFANLLGWMLDVSPRDGRIAVRGRRRPQEVQVQIEGGSATAPLLPHSAERFAAGGFGLSIAHTLVTTMGGSLEARRCATGTLFTVNLPRPPALRVRKRPLEQRLLVVGEPDLQQVVTDLVQRDGFEVVPASSAEEALERLESDPEIGAVATQLFLDGMSGLSLVCEVLRRHGHLHGRVLLLTDARLPEDLPAQAQVVRTPLRRVELLEALGRRARRGR